MSQENVNELVERNQVKKTTNIFLMSFENDKNIKKLLSEDNNDSSDEESISKSRISLKTKNHQEEEKNIPFIMSNKDNENSDNNINALKLYDDTNQDEGENKNESRRTFIDRIIGPIDAGSIRGSIFNLSIFSLGSGSLALPQKIQHMSIVVAIIDIILSGLATYWTLNLMVIASRKLKNCFNYAKVVELLYGKKISNFLVFTIMVYTLGIMILYQVVGNFIFILMNDIYHLVRLFLKLIC